MNSELKILVSLRKSVKNAFSQYQASKKAWYDPKDKPNIDVYDAFREAERKYINFSKMYDAAIAASENYNHADVDDVLEEEPFFQL